MVYVPAGPFLMGSSADDALAECQKVTSDCRPRIILTNEPLPTVYPDAFWIDQTEVTNAITPNAWLQAPASPPRICSSICPQHLL